MFKLIRKIGAVGLLLWFLYPYLFIVFVFVEFIKSSSKNYSNYYLKNDSEEDDYFYVVPLYYWYTWVFGLLLGVIVAGQYEQGYTYILWVYFVSAVLTFIPAIPKYFIEKNNPNRY